MDQTIKAINDLLLALPAVLSAIGAVFASIKAQKSDQKETRELASEAAPSARMLFAQTKPTA